MTGDKVDVIFSSGQVDRNQPLVKNGNGIEFELPFRQPDTGKRLLARVQVSRSDGSWAYQQYRADRTCRVPEGETGEF